MSKASAPVEPRPAASAVILRDTPNGLETFMLQRNRGAGMAFSGALVFPGGKVDAEDGADDWLTLAPATAATPDRAFWITAVRETFEEAGLLLARHASGADLVDADTAHRLVEAERSARGTVSAGAFHDLVRRERLVLAVDQMIHFGHWITPSWAPKRFDTHFFLVAAPVTQHGAFDDSESEEGMWLQPAQALADADAGRRTLVDVTRFTLELLASWPDVATAVAAARRRTIVTIRPELLETSEGSFISIPRDAGYLSDRVPYKR
jgi:8-oxo-dGTP pyrophosphatase MutT (NUDIX family)